jgi:hypothetical protein
LNARRKMCDTNLCVISSSYGLTALRAPPSSSSVSFLHHSETVQFQPRFQFVIQNSLTQRLARSLSQQCDARLSRLQTSSSTVSLRLTSFGRLRGHSESYFRRRLGFDTQVLETYDDEIHQVILDISPISRNHKLIHLIPCNPSIILSLSTP